MNKRNGEQNIAQTIIKSFLFLLILTIQIVLLIILYKSANDLFLYEELIFDLIKICSIIYIAYKPINPSYKISWIILIAILPVLGVLAFLLFGNVGVRKKLKKNIDKNIEASSYYLNFKKEDYMILKEMDIYKYKQACYLTNISDLPIYRSNNLEYLSLGETYFEKLLFDLKKAEKYIFLEYFIISKSSMWNNIFEVLKEKSEKGVKIFILTDQIGSGLRLPEFYKENFNLINMQTKLFNPITPFISAHLNYRDHRKIAVIDGKIAYTGGLNIGDEYINKNCTLGQWKDFGVKVTGHAVTNFVIMFLRMWNLSEKDTPLDYGNYIYEEPNYPNDDNGFILPFCDGPNNKNNPAENTYINMINSAKKSIYITTPYLVLDNEMIVALVNAAYSGIDVRILLPHKPDKKMVFALSRSFYDKLLAAGVKIYEYAPGFIHGKECIVDCEVAVVGTINFDFRSLYLHYECGVWSYNTYAEKKMADDFLDMLNNSIQIKYDKWHKRPIFKKIIEALLIMIAPFL